MGGAIPSALASKGGSDTHQARDYRGGFRERLKPALQLTAFAGIGDQSQKLDLLGRCQVGNPSISL
jgi:hypothetical protein